MTKKSLAPCLFTMLLLAPAARADHPNILFFLVDDMGAQDTSVPFHFDESGAPIRTKTNRLFRTPNMESLASTGMRFTNAYAYAVCSPTRVSLLTGQDALRHGVTTWTDPHKHEVDTGAFKSQELVSARWNTKGVPENSLLVTQIMKQAGYRNLFAGKAHFGPNNTRNGDPLNLAFDVNIAGHGAGGPGSYYGEKNFGEGKWHVPGLEKYHGTKTFLTEALTLEMSHQLEQAVQNKQHFFCYMSHYAVHAPFHTDPRFVDNYGSLKGHDKAYATLVEGMDKSLGDLLAKLDELDIAEETLVIFYSDNGSARMMANGQPHRGMKGHRHEGGLRVPLIVSWAKPNPKNPIQQQLPIQPNSVEHDVVTCMDLLPTLADLTGYKIKPDAPVDGHSLLPYLQNKNGVHRPQEFIAHFPHGRHNNNLYTSYRKENWKLIYSYRSKQWELYDLSADVGEQHNLVKENAAQARALAKELITTLQKRGANFPRHPDTDAPLIPELNTLNSQERPSN